MGGSFFHSFSGLRLLILIFFLNVWNVNEDLIHSFII